MLSSQQVRSIAAPFLESLQLSGKTVLLVVPDATRTAPVGLLFETIFDLVGEKVEKLDVMIALGTHAPMSEDQINARLEIDEKTRAAKYKKVGYFNHEWDNSDALQLLGTIPAAEISELSGGLFSMDVPVTFNKRALTYDQILILGPVFPHEVVGFSGGNKYLFPGIGGPEILNFFHWLGAIISNARIIGHAYTPVRAVVDRAAQMVPVKKDAFCMVVDNGELAALAVGTPEDAWREASQVSAQLHVIHKKSAFHTVLSCAPKMYDDLWVGGKCMYKLEPVVADGGELIIYAPHITEISSVHGELIERIGYHCRDYFLMQWDKFKDESWGVLAHSTHVRGVGEMRDGVEYPRVRVTLATQIPREICEKINLGYRDPNSINIADFENREDEGILVVEKAGEYLYRLENEPEWARE
ncbi:Nickel-dependent lactate racemase [Abditibacterium utsteinense]|uniref:Nickel-dependent lactate racemase n=1 Tax=Abditibacterium utsteinense TaxID=1960156 RepID=A0A2S8SV38_9BACT|nr:lactate racemase domain-containing protein [Abditibacterium utsteinense]PQV64646.1 Nickel-dependent lactate racemase [Abditibacterium utsteinense]